MKILLILDPLDRLNVNYDTSLAFIRTFTRRGHECFFCDTPELFVENGEVRAITRSISPKQDSLEFETGSPKNTAVLDYKAVLVRKEPPFDISFVYMTYMLELVSGKMAVLNDPRGLRDANEKFSSVEFAKLMPQTLVTASRELIHAFQKKLKTDLILKPLDERGGRGLSILSLDSPMEGRTLDILTHKGRTPILAQAFIKKPGLIADKRVFMLEGKLLAAYERHFASGDFRGNLGQGATHHRTVLTKREKAAIMKIGPWLKKKGLHFAGLDLLDGRLLEINVTCPGGFPEADELYPQRKVFDKFALSVEKIARAKKN